jgi:hypothetical protein
MARRNEKRRWFRTKWAKYIKEQVSLLKQHVYRI